ncbi:molybdenum cofactor guanylyltransferase [Deinococcus sp.]|uniref:molybdenum cofactor guanylyltransferase n=1 Tax=Deinococcus sp. TaxID=47478 RepID=UPI00286E79A2|nr:molybdenum cofactor guanylyltransferase [Deinococcus sp.]
MPSAPPPYAAAITAGGQSRRFGQDKALYRVGDAALLYRVAASLDAFAPRILIAPAGKYLLPGWQTVPDLRPGEGPLAGLETALDALDRTDPAGRWLAFAAVDLPHLTPGFWTMLTRRAGAGMQAVAGLDATGRTQPLAALYHSSVLAQVSSLLDGGERRMAALLERLVVAQVPWQQIASSHPEVYLNLHTLPEQPSGAD